LFPAPAWARPNMAKEAIKPQVSSCSSLNSLLRNPL
jgi:hypothetical protein